MAYLLFLLQELQTTSWVDIKTWLPVNLEEVPLYLSDDKPKYSHRAYIWGVALAGMFVLAYNLPPIPSGQKFLNISVLALLIVYSESQPINMPRGGGTFSVAPPLIFVAAVIYGISSAVWLACLATIRKKDILGLTPFRVVLFNRGMLSICAYLFGLVYYGLNGNGGSFSLPGDVLPFFCASAVYILANALLVSVALTFRLNTSFSSVWRSNIKWNIPSMLSLIPLGIILVVLYQLGPLLLVLFYLPMMAVRHNLGYKELSGALCHALDARDPYTHGHSERVAEYSVYIGEELKLPDEELDLLKHVAVLHDLGKVGLRDEIMKKPGAFTLEEYEAMKQHADIGADILAGLNVLGRGEDWVRYHHERWDGMGYPKGLSGENIPLPARIIACADAFDAMTTDRPYKKRMSYENAKQELIRCSGSQFDPRVVEAMLRVIDKHLTRKNRVV